jgi:hypothetical protein
MPTLREQILASPETFSDLAWAAEQRFQDGEALLSSGRFGGAVYLTGIACEMWLKLASFRLVRAGPATSVRDLLGPIRTWMAVTQPQVEPEAYHSLRFWAEHLLRRRVRQDSALPSTAAGRLRHHVVGRLFQDWKIDLRYRRAAVSERHAWRVYNDAVWLRGAWNSLWR